MTVGQSVDGNFDWVRTLLDRVDGTDKYKRAEQISVVLTELTQRFSGDLGLCVIDSDGEEVFVKNSDMLFPMASVCKAAILYTAVADGLDLDRYVLYREEDRRMWGRGLTEAPAGGRYTIRELLTSMMSVSDNTATDMILKLVPPSRVNQRMKQLGLSSIQIDRTLLDVALEWHRAVDERFNSAHSIADIRTLLESDRELAARVDDPLVDDAAVMEITQSKDRATPRDICGLFRAIAERRGLTVDAHSEILEIFKQQQYNNQLPHFRAQFPDDVWYAHKTGSLAAVTVRNDAGILYCGATPMAYVAFFSRGNTDDIATLNSTIGRIGATIALVYGASR